MTNICRIWCTSVCIILWVCTSQTLLPTHSDSSVCVCAFFVHVCVCVIRPDSAWCYQQQRIWGLLFITPLYLNLDTLSCPTVQVRVCVCVFQHGGGCMCVYVYATEWEIWEWETVNVIDRARGGKRTVNDRLRVHVRACVFVCVGPAEGVSEKQRHVTLNKGEMRGYDWLFSDVTDCEPSQLETIIRSLVTPSASSPLLYPIFPLFCLSALHPNFLPLCL